MTEYRRHLPPDASLPSLHVALNRLWEALEAQGGVTASAPARSAPLGSSPTFVTGAPSPVATSHNALSGIQGGNTDNYYHLTASEYTGTGTGVFARQDSPSLTGNPTATTQSLTDNSTRIATTAWVTGQNYLKTVAHDYTLTGDGTVASPLSIPPFLYFGVVTKPTFTDLGTGSFTVGTGLYSLSSTVAGDEIPNQYTVLGATFTPADGTTQYVVASYNGGIPNIQMLTSLATVDWIQVVPIFVVHRDGTSILVNDWDTLGVSLPNKISHGLAHTMPFAHEDGLSLGEAATRLVTISPGTVWLGSMVETPLSAFNSGVNTLHFYYHVGGVWTESTVTQYNNSQYDDGTNLQSLTGNHYGVVWVFRRVSSTTSEAFCVLGTGNYLLPDAEASQVPALPPVIAPMSVLVGRIIIKNADTTATVIESAFSQSFRGGTVATFSSLSGTCTTTQGGTGLTSYTLGDMLYASAANTLSALAGYTTAAMAVLTMTGTGASAAAPVWTATTGTGSIARANTPTLVTPVLGVATATSINKVAITAPATSATLTITDGKTLTASNTLTFSGTDGSTLNIGTGGTLGTAAYMADSSMVHTTGDESIAGIKSFTNTTACTSATTGAVTGSGGYGSDMTTLATASGSSAVMWLQSTANPASASATSFFGARYVSQSSVSCTQNFTGVIEGIRGNAIHSGSGTLSQLRGNSNISTVGTGGGAVTTAYGSYNELTINATAAQTFATARGLFVLNSVNSSAGATITAWSGIETSFTLTAAAGITTLRSVLLNAIAVTAVTTTTTIAQLDIGAINGASTTPATNAYAIRTGNVTGATNNWQLNLGTGISKFSDTTDSTNTTTGSIQTLGGMAITKALWVGGLANIAGALTAASFTGSGSGLTAIPVGAMSATGTPSAATFLRGDGTWSTGVSSAALPWITISLTPPAPASFTWTNQGSATATAQTGQTTFYNSSGVASSINIMKQAYSGSKRATAGILPLVLRTSGSSSLSSGIYVGDTGANKWIEFGVIQIGTAAPYVRVESWTNPTTASALLFSSGAIPSASPVFLAIRDDATNLYFEISLDGGQNWDILYQQARTTFLASPNAFGFGQTQGTTGQVSRANFIHWAVA